MSTLREAAQQALEALEGKRYTACGWRSDCDKAITALRAALAEPVQETGVKLKPVFYAPRRLDDEEVEAIIAAPPQRKPLTEEEILSLFRTSGSPTAFARAIERAHGIT